MRIINKKRMINIFKLNRCKFRRVASREPRFPGLNKSAQGHVEVILSMVLFIGFLIFIFLFLAPSFRAVEEVPVDNIQLAILNNITSKVGKLSVIVDNTITHCYDLNDVSYGTDFIEVQDPDINERFTIYYNDYFNGPKVGVRSCSALPSRDPNPPNHPYFSLGVYVTEKIITETLISDSTYGFKTRYITEYEKLKQALVISDDFSFEFKDSDGAVITDLSVEKNIPGRVNVFSKEFPVRVINRNAEINEYLLNIKVWR